MSKVKLIAENTSFLLIGKIIAKAISFYTVILVARYLGDVGYGRYNFAFAFISFFSILSELGILRILLREISKNPETAGKMIGNATLIKGILSVLAFFLAIVSVNLMGYSTEVVKGVQVASLILLVDMLNTYGIIYEANLKMKYSVFFFMLSHLCTFVLIIIITYFNLGLNLIILATVATNAIQNILTYKYSRKLIKVNFEIDPKICKYLLKESLPLALSSVFTVIYYRIDMVMLSLMIGDAAVGIYSAGYRLSEAFLLIPNVLMVSLFPLMSNLFENHNNTLVFSYEKATKYLFSIALPMAVGTGILSDRIITLVYGNTFKDSSMVLQILIWATAIIFLNYPTGNFYISIKKQKFVMLYTGFGVVVNLLLNYILIPKYSYIGASIATVFTELSILLITTYCMPSFISKRRLIFNNYASIIATAIMSIFLLSDIKNYIGLLIIIPSIIIYSISFYLLKGLDIDDKRLIKKMMGKYIQRL